MCACYMWSLNAHESKSAKAVVSGKLDRTIKAKTGIGAPIENAFYFMRMLLDSRLAAEGVVLRLAPRLNRRTKPKQSGHADQTIQNTHRGCTKRSSFFSATNGLKTDLLLFSAAGGI